MKTFYLLMFVLFSTLCIEQTSKENDAPCSTIQPGIEYEEKLHSLNKAGFELEIPRKGICIPIIFHVIHSGEEYGENENFPDEDIEKIIEKLNETYYKAGNVEPWFGGGLVNVADDPRIRFCLAHIDRQVYNTGIPIQLIKEETIKDPENFLNIWTINQSNTNSQSTFPPLTGLEGLDDNIGNILNDGIILSYWSTYHFLLNTNRNTISHEVGHWLGLRHMWGDGIIGEECQNDDYCNDTPNVSEPYSGVQCGTDPATLTPTCNGLQDPQFINIMTYSHCKKLTTSDQVERMHTALKNSPLRVKMLQNSVYRLPIIHPYNGKKITSFCKNYKVNPLVDNNDDIEIYNGSNSRMKSTETSDLTNISIYPNPANDFITVSLGSANIHTIELFDILGNQLVHRNTNNSSLIKLDLNAFENGTYIIKAFDKKQNAVQTIKFIKAK